MLEVENSKSEKNHFLAEFVLSEIRPAKAGITKIFVEVKFEIDVTGILYEIVILDRLK